MSDSASVGMDSNQKRRVSNHNLCAPLPSKSIRPAFFLKFGDSCLYPTVVYHLLWAPKGSDNVSGSNIIEKQESDKSKRKSAERIPPKQKAVIPPALFQLTISYLTTDYTSFDSAKGK